MTTVAPLPADWGADGHAAVLSQDSPPVALEWVRRLLASHYGLAGTLTPMSGERDRNHRLQSDADGACFLLKLSHPAEAPLVADFQTRTLLHLARADPGLPVQRIVPTLDGTPSFCTDAGDGPPRVVRLFSYLSGQPLPEAPRSAAQRANLARMLARVDAALQDFRHPAGARSLPWDIQHAGTVRGLLQHVADPARRALAARALDRFEQAVAPHLPTLRRQPIHNDLNPNNVLVDPADPDRITGILDFGDMVEAPLIDDLAVAAAYQLGGHGDPLTEVLPFVAAYHAVLPLQRAELDLLFPLMTARLVMVVAISGWRAARDPANAAYLLRNNAPSWARLAACDALAPEGAARVLRAACGIE